MEPGENGLFVVMKRLGHKDIRTTVNIYGHLTTAKDKTHADALGIAWDATDKPASNVFELHQGGAA